jgi:hypothetical protein
MERGGEALKDTGSKVVQDALRKENEQDEKNEDKESK